MSEVQIFGGKRFFFLQRIPLRQSFIEDVERNGGRVVKLEKDADYIIADHCRPDAPTGSISWKFIEDALKQGEIPDKTPYIKGGNAADTSTATGPSRPNKSTRTPFTSEEDKLLWNWVKSRESMGGLVKGNEIYKQLEAQHPRHTYQSWRDRYLKQLLVKPPVGVGTGAPLTPPMEPLTSGSPQPEPRDRRPTHQPTQVGRTMASSSRTPQPSARSHDETGLPQLSEAHLEALLDDAKYIEDIPRKRWEAAWNSWAEKFGTYTPEEWIQLYGTVARPIYYKRQEEQAKKLVAIMPDSEAAETIARPERVNTGAAPRATLDGSGPAPLTSQVRAATVAEKRGPDQATQQESTVLHPGDRADAAVHSPRKRQRVEKPWTPFKLPRITNDKAGAGSAAVPQRSEQDPLSPAQPGSKHGPSRTESERGTSVTSAVRQFVADGPGAALTKENLARMQANHQHPKARRAVDLMEDDKEEDQTAFAEKLTNLLPQGNAELTRAAQRLSALQDDGEEVAETDEAASAKEDDEQSHVSSQELGSPIKTQRRPVPLNTQTAENAANTRTKTPPSMKSNTRKALTPRRTSSDIDVALADAQLRGEATQEARRPLQHIVEGSNPTDRRMTGSRNAFAGTTPFQHKPLGISVAISSSPPIPPLANAFDDRGERVSQTIELDLSFPELGSEAYAHMSSPSSDAVMPSIEGVLEARKITMPSLRQLDTRAIFEEETQEVNHELPGFDDLVSPIAPVFDPPDRRQSAYMQNSSRSPTPIPSQNEIDVDEYIDRKVREGADEDQVMTALEATCMQVGVAEVALGFLSKGEDLPRTITGIWTEDDDAALVANDQERISIVDAKHGWMEMRRRSEFLMQLRE